MVRIGTKVAGSVMLTSGLSGMLGHRAQINGSFPQPLAPVPYEVDITFLA